ncbi:unnamed protein product [Microthlaspi erraticum]|uniref:Uncharacterized protein n=1 Tax=Microthlaspi erraticum TaxID=1685480 RepID=A0A6D2IWU4_9BRAS|nr:unnamed protein product [Microthlaspi erraticum]
MDFIKTSSLRALIELTFQRKWNGLIWMSRKGVIAKRVKAAPDGSIENQRRTAQTGWPRNDCSALGQSHIRPTEVSAKVQPPADHTHDPGKLPAVGQATHVTPRRARPAARAGNKPRGRATRSRTTADASVRAGKTSHVRPRNHRPNSIRPTTPADRSDRPDPADRRPSERRGRPEAVFEAQSAQFKPKAGADLARLAPPPSWDSPPRPSTLKTKKKLLPYLEAADLETSSQAASHQEEHLLATPEEEINPELIEFVKRDQFHDLFSEYALEHIDHFDNLCDSYGVFDFEKKMMLFSTSLAGPALDWAQHEPPLQSSHGSILEKLSWKGFARKPPFKSKYTTTLISWRESVMKKNGEAYHPILKF